MNEDDYVSLITKTKHGRQTALSQGETYLGEEPGSTKEGDEVPIAEPLRELEPAVSIGILLTDLHVWGVKFVERAHHLLDRLVFEPRTILDRKLMCTEGRRGILRKAMRDLFTTRRFFIHRRNEDR